MEACQVHLQEKFSNIAEKNYIKKIPMWLKME